MRILRIFIVMVGVALILFAGSNILRVSIDVGPTGTANETFAKTVGRPINLLIGGDPQDTAAFRAAIQERDPTGLISVDSIPQNPAEADAVVIFLDGWDSVETAPWQAELARDYDRVRRGDTNSASISVTMFDGGRPSQTTIYDTTQYQGWTMDCYAALFMHTIAIGTEEPFFPPSGCPL